MNDYSDATTYPPQATDSRLSGAAMVCADQTLRVQFWGVRGNIPSPGAETVRYGGNTACVEVLVGNQRLIFDAGTGFRVLGQHMAQQAYPVDASLFFTHTHWDRIQGFPFFIPAFLPQTRLKIYGAPALKGACIKQLLTDQMLRPNFFKPLQTMKAQMTFHNIQAGHVIELEDVTVETISLNRHTNALGYRVNWQDLSLVYATDTDPTQAEVDPGLVYLAQGADVLIFDGTYADAAYTDPDPLPLAPWQLSIQVAEACGVDQLVLFHHNPCHGDDQLDELERKVKAQFSQACLAKEGMAITVAV
jgi:phosphoribosyl 1,2-cyclic phosphodiesterase